MKTNIKYYKYKILSLILLGRKKKKYLKKCREIEIFNKSVDIIKKSDFFDEDWYLSHNPDVLKAQAPAAEHYFLFGYKEGRNPSEFFDGNLYLQLNPDVKEQKLNPLLHWEVFGKKEGREIGGIRKELPKINSTKQNSRVVYTCVTGNYDTMPSHEYYNPDWDYVCFTDDYKLLMHERVGVWKIRKLAYTEANSVKNARWHKTHPHILFPMYKYSLWVDGSTNILNKRFFDKIENCIACNLTMSVRKHPDRNDIYEECAALCDMQRDNIDVMTTQIGILKQLGFPEQTGLHETNIIFRKHKDLNVISMMEEWWSWILQYSKRDQLSFDYILWKYNYKMLDLPLINATYVKNKKDADFTKHVIHPSTSITYKCETISIIVPIYNALDLTKQFLSSVLRSNLSSNVDITLINDASDAETTDYLRRFVKKNPRFTLLENEKNMQFVRTCNRGMRLAKGDIVVLLNADTMIPQGWERRVLECFNSDSKIGIASPIGSLTGLFNLPYLDGMNLDEMDAYIEKKSMKAYPVVLCPEGFCFCIRKKAMDVLGFLSEEYCPIYCEETDYACRALHNGWKTVIIDNLYVYHKGSGSVGSEFRKKMCEQHWKILMSHWQFLWNVRESKYHTTETILAMMEYFKNPHFEMRYKKNYDYYNNVTPENYKQEIEEFFYLKTGKFLDLENPKTFNEKTQWLKLYDSTPLKEKLADKILVRDWIKEKIGEEYLIPMIGTYDSFEDIDFTVLPQKFVIKCNHGAGYNIVVKSKDELDILYVKNKVNHFLKTNFAFQNGFELHYKNIKPRILIEEYIENNNEDIYDYKVWCFNGKPQYIQFLSERSSGLKMSFFDTDWKQMEFVYTYPRHEKAIPRPKNLDKMLELAEKLAQGFAFVRVDFYVLNNGEIKFGEMTFTSYSGYCDWHPAEWDLKLGQKLQLPIQNSRKNIVGLWQQETFSYPQFPYLPLCPEYPFQKGNENGNEIYDMVRNCFHLMGYDKENFGTKHWNPLKDIVFPGDTVLIKPNLVTHHNHSEKGTDCLYTHPSVTSAVIDFVAIALKGRGKIIVADAPVQECDFEKLITESGYDKLIESYKQKGLDICLLDLRNIATTVKDGVRVLQETKYKEEGIVVQLNEKSSFAKLSKQKISNLRIPNYDPRILQQHHNSLVHEYKIAKRVLDADVIINIPKPKTHRKAGMTCALKNIVGINTNKEFLPHHTLGSADEEGDSYLKKNPLLAKANLHLDKGNILQAEGNFSKAKKHFESFKQCKIKGDKITKESYWDGSWYGNDTIWRTVVDLNKVLLYADKKGIIQKQPQRRYFIVADMVVAGHEEGPMAASPKNAGIIAMAEDAVCCDKAICSIMGFNWRDIPSILYSSMEYNNDLPITCSQEVVVLSNNQVWNAQELDYIAQNYSLNFIPTMGWKKKLVR